MGFFASIFGCSRNSNRRYVSEVAFRENLSKQTAMSPQTIAALRKHGVSSSAALRLDFFFYTDAELKAQQLAGSLRALKYEVESKPSAHDARLIEITGRTTPIRMSENEVISWTREMCELGYKHDCTFDGWGTSTSQ